MTEARTAGTEDPLSGKTETESPESPLQRSQRLHPERWRDFYDRVAELWEDMGGTSGRLGPALADFIQSRGLAVPGDSVLDLGCGPGALAMILAIRGFRVTALDDSPAMIRVLRDKIRANPVRGIRTRVGDWREYSPRPKHRLAVACFFPGAFRPWGLRRMESLASGRCLLVLGEGGDSLPLRRILWEKMMETPPGDPGVHRTRAERHLRAEGRAPQVETLSLPAHLDVAADRIERFYRAYFAIFEKTGPRLDRALAETLAEHARGGRVRMDGTLRLSLLHWTPRSPEPPEDSARDRRQSR